MSTGPNKVKKAPAAVQFYLRSIMAQILGADPPLFTEADFTPEELEAIRAAVANSTEPGIIGYGDYPTQQPWAQDGNNLLQELDMIFSDPARSAMLALGMANVKNGIVTDQYNFGAPPEATVGEALAQVPNALSSSNPRAILNLLGNIVGLRNDRGPQVRIDLNPKDANGQ